MSLFDIFKKEDKLIKNDEDTEEKIYSDNWGYFTLSVENPEQLEYGRKCVKYFDNIPSDIKAKLQKYLFRYFMACKEYLEDEELQLHGKISEDNMLDKIKITTLIIDGRCNQDIIEFQLEGNCFWEPEHGVEITISDNKILYVGEFVDNPPCYCKDKWISCGNYADKE